MSPPCLSYINTLLHCLPIKWFIIVLIPSTSRYMKESGIATLTLGDILRYLGLCILISTCSGWKRDDFWSVNPFDKEANAYPYCLREFMYKPRFNSITREPRFTNTKPPPYVDRFWQNFQMVKAWNDHMNFIFLSSW